MDLLMSGAFDARVTGVGVGTATGAGVGVTAALIFGQVNQLAMANPLVSDLSQATNNVHSCVLDLESFNFSRKNYT